MSLDSRQCPSLEFHLKMAFLGAGDLLEVAAKTDFVRLNPGYA